MGVDHIGIRRTAVCASARSLSLSMEIGYSGYVTVHQAFEGVMTVDAAVRRGAEYLKTVIA